MFDEPLPKQADLRKLTSSGVNLKSHLDVANFPRLANVVHQEQGQVDIDLHFGVDDQHIRYIAGSVNCKASVICQRCLEPVAIQFGSDMLLGIVWSEEKARHLPESMDPLIVVENELVDLNEVVEEELLLSLPFVSFHEMGECTGKQRYESFSEDMVAPVVKENPFKVLEKLKTGKE
jgi:uncharacterized protein